MPRQLLASRLERRVIGGEEMVAAGEGRPFLHPWSAVQAEWLPGKFGPSAPYGMWGLVIKPGFVNGIDPVVKGAMGYDESVFSAAVVSSQRASLGLARREVAVQGEDRREIFGTKRRDMELLRGPIIPLDFSMGQAWPQERACPAAISLRGVPSRLVEGDAFTVSDSGGIKVNQTRLDEADRAAAEPQRRAVSVDLILGVARYTLTESAEVSDAAMDGRLVQYNVGFDDLVIRSLGTRPFLYVVGNAEEAMEEREPSLVERFFGQTKTDDGIDKAHILRAWAVSPLFDKGQAPERVGPDWDVVFEYRQFWNLAYKTRIPRLVQPPPPISFFAGLAWGLGDAIINYNLGLQDEVLSRMLLAGANLAPKGRFWSV